MSDERNDGYVRRVRPNEDSQSRRDALGSRPSPDPEDSGSGGSGAQGDEGADSEMVSAYGGKDKDKAKSGAADEPGGSDDASENDDSGGGKKKKKKDGGVKGLKKRLQRMQQMLAVAKTVHQGMMMAQLMMYLKTFLQAMMALAQAAAAAISSAIAAVVQMAVTVATTVATAIGVSVAVATGGLAVLVLVAVIAVVAVVGDVTGGAGTKDDIVPDCNTDASYMNPVTPADPSAAELANAKIVYAFFKAYGLPDENIAGILGNWTTESHIDPTGTETIFSEPFTIPVEGTRKYNAWKGVYYTSSGGTTGPVDYTMVKEISRAGTEHGLVSLATAVGGYDDARRFKNYHSRFPAIKRIGIGLGQWTNDRNQMLLDFADDMGMNWYDLETQLMFMICLEGGDSRARTMAGWTPESSAESAAKWFYAKWEGGGGGDPEKTPDWRIENANMWFRTLQTWVEGVDYDMEYARTLLASVANAGAAGGDRAGSSSLRKCSGLSYGDNSSAAKAAVAFSWGPGEAYDNDGTACWRHLADALYEGDVLYRSCDRTVAAALWWSGTDTEFPKNLGRGMNSGQLGYMVTSDNWEPVAWGGDYDNLLPGDVLIRSDLNDDGVHHVVMYVGPDAVVERFGETYDGHDSRKYFIASGSYGQFSPHVNGPDRTAGTGFQTYYAFRCVSPNNQTPEKTQLTCVG